MNKNKQLPDEQSKNIGTDLKDRISVSLKRSGRAVSDYIDILLVVIALWASLVIFSQVRQTIPELGWPYYLDEVLFLVLIFFLCFITSMVLKPIIIVAVIISCLYLISKWISNFGMRNEKAAIENQKSINIDADVSIPFPPFSEYKSHMENKLERMEKKQDSLLKKYQLLQMEMDSIKHGLHTP